MGTEIDPNPYPNRENPTGFRVACTHCHPYFHRSIGQVAELHGQIDMVTCSVRARGLTHMKRLLDISGRVLNMVDHGTC
jgi:hypothetical protein